MSYRLCLSVSSVRKCYHHIVLMLLCLLSQVTCSLVHSSNLSTCLLTMLLCLLLQATCSLVHSSNLSTHHSCLNKGIYIYIIRRQKSVKFNYFSNLPICRRYANSLNRRKLLICRTASQSIDLHMITKEQNQAI